MAQVVKQIKEVKCTKCGSSHVHINKRATNQYLCDDCGKYFTLRKLSDSTEELIIKCYACEEELPFNGKNRLIPCPKCEQKNFITTENKAVDPYSLDQGVGTLNLDIASSEDHIHIIPIGDVHVGAPRGQCDMEKFERELSYIERTDNCYMIGMGDLMDCAQKMVSKGPNLFASSLMPMEQVSLIEEKLRPLAKKGKIIGLLTGNHEEWIMHSTGIQVMSMIAKNLGVTYLGHACDINIQLRDQFYTLYALHGSGNAQLKHTKLGRLINVSKDIFADCCIMGHVHQLGVTKGGKYQLGNTSKSYYVLTGHFLNWIGSYAHAFGLDVCPSGCPKITLFADRKDIHISI
jgi:UDP-2,3-diacylglucosamine pyrophosphatase LpxH/predicted RNA-binding Zn-ribbon protein involved in translation (DUF1610 family)